MIPDTEVLARLERLESDNRRLKRVATVALVIAAALAAIAATRPVPEKITAHEFDVMDSAGRVRIRLSTTPVKASVDVLDTQDTRTASMEVNQGDPFITVGKMGGDVVQLSSSVKDGASVAVFHMPNWSAMSAGKSGKALFDALLSFRAQLVQPSVAMEVLPSGTADFSVRDTQGFRMDMGNTDVISSTGAAQHTSADSIIMFGNDKKHRAIWRAP